MSSLQFEKPTTRTSIADWFGKVWEVRQTSDTKRSDTAKAISESRQLRNELNISSDWLLYHNNVKLSDRITEIRRYLDLLERAGEAAKEEIKVLKDERLKLEIEITKYNNPTRIVMECLRLRDGREGYDLCYDQADTELKKERDLIEEIKKNMTNKSATSWNQLNNLEETLFKVNTDIMNKKEALAVDVNCLTLGNECTNVCFKPDVLRLPKDVVSYEQWVEQSRLNIERMDNELTSSVKLREAILYTQQKSRNDFRTQTEGTNYELRKHVYETNRIKNELEWQKLNVLKLMESLKREMDRAENSKQAKINTIKCAETKIDNRNFRPSLEMTIDPAQAGFMEEVVQIRKSMSEITNKLTDLKGIYNSCENLIYRIENDLRNKYKCIQFDQQCLEIRKDLQTPITQFDKNVTLIKMEKEIPPEP